MPPKYGCGVRRNGVGPGLARLEASVEPRNEWSLRALRKCGFVIEGVLRSYLYLAGRYRDAVSLFLTPADMEQS